MRLSPIVPSAKSLSVVRTMLLSAVLIVRPPLIATLFPAVSTAKIGVVEPDACTCRAVVEFVVVLMSVAPLAATCKTDVPLF